MTSIHEWANATPLIIGIATDHGGLEKKTLIKQHLEQKGYTLIDYGPYELDPADDYPDFAAPLCKDLVRNEINAGILLCRSGIGMSICANRFPGIRAALVEDEAKAHSCRDHNNANVLVTGGDKVSNEDVLKIIDIWLTDRFSEDARHVNRLRKLEELCRDEVAAIRNVDAEIAELIEDEALRQESGIELIASENFASPAVRAAVGSILTNKYAEGYPGKRYYNGCEVVDKIEQIAIDRACQLFQAEAANVQPHSGSQANAAVYAALLQPGDTILALDLAHGGHLTHGHKVNFSGRTYNFHSYYVDPETEVLNYDTIEQQAKEIQPKMIVAGASAYPRIIDFPRLRQIADSVGALLFTDMAHIAGLVAAGEHPNPVPYCDVVSTTTHKTLRGPRGGLILGKQEYIKKINSAIFPGTQGGPLMHVIAGKAICFKEAMTPEYKAYQAQVRKNAQALAEALTAKGFRIVSGGTDNHLLLVDLRPKHITGKIAADVLDLAGITANMNLIPYDPEKPTVTSGIRLGTPAVTTRGMKEEDMVQIAEWINTVIENYENEEIAEQVKSEIYAYMQQFPMPKYVIG